jgi:hypothetical protein
MRSSFCQKMDGYSIRLSGKNVDRFLILTLILAHAKLLPAQSSHVMKSRIISRGKNGARIPK